MTQPALNGECILEADRKSADFPNVPADIKELTIMMVRPSEAAELSLLGRRLKHLTKLMLQYGVIERLDFLESFHSIRTLICQLHDLKDYTGIGHCVKLTHLSLSASLSSVGSLAFLRHLSDLEWLHLEGPNPSKGIDKIESLQKVKRLSLYAPQWRMEQLPLHFPGLEDLSIWKSLLHWILLTPESWRISTPSGDFRICVLSELAMLSAACSHVRSLAALPQLSRFGLPVAVN